MTPTVSVLVTVYNRERWLGACLESILASTWQDFEVIVVDDQSSDGSLALAESFAARDQRIRVVRNERNLGDYPNRMRAAELATGRFLKYVDSDDLIYRHSLAIMVEAMEAHPEAALGLAHSELEAEQPYPWRLDSVEVWRRQFLGRGCLGAGPSSAIIRREAFFATGGFRDWGVLNDADLWLRMAARWPVVLLPPALVWWRRHEGQEFTRDDAASVYRERGFALVMDSLASAECPLPPDERDSARRRFRQHHARRLWAAALRRRRPWEILASARRAGLTFGEIVSGLRRYA